MIFLIFLILGLIMGSFLSASVWRLYKQTGLKSELKKNKENSIIKGRSICPNCKHELAPLDLIPVVSWVMLKGRCRYCHNKIGWQEPLVELASGLAFSFSYFYWPYKFNSEGKILFAFWLVILSLFIILILFDLRWRILPNKIVAVLTAVVAAQVLVKLIFYSGGANTLVNAFWGVVFISGLFYLLYRLSNGRWIGGGDVKLGVALGLLVGGPAEAILVVFGASLLGTVISVPLMALNKLKRTSMIAFGPLLITATTVCYFFGSDIINWYKNLVLIGH
jgi:prepilin signal peptidase PulO-like enzyme (type II secretory pathway)